MPDIIRVEQPHTAVGHSWHEAAQYPATCATCAEEADLCTCTNRRPGERDDFGHGDARSSCQREVPKRPLPTGGCDIHGPELGR